MNAAAKKIVFLSLNRFNPVLCDGVSNSMLELLLFLKRQGHDVSISTVYTHEEYHQFVFRYLAARRSENGNGPAWDAYLAELKGVEVWQAKEWPSHLDYRGDLTDFREFYGRISVLLVPSLVEEAFSRVILEAAVNGIPVVANRVGGIPEALGEGGLLVDVDLSRADEAGMLDAMADEYQIRIDQLLSDGEFYALLGRRALARAQAYQENQAQVSRRHCAELLGVSSD